MPDFVHGSRFTVHGFKNSVNRQLSVVNCRRRRLGFSLIELMVVISLFGLAASLVTASYLSFERNYRIKSAASVLKSDLRLVQNQAYSGDKGPGGLCSSTSFLGGWYLSIAKNQTSYTIGGDCISGSSEAKFFDGNSVSKTINLPRDIVVNKIFYDSNSNLGLPMAIFFRPLSSSISFHDATFALAPDFFENDGVTLRNLLSQPPQSAVVIQLSNTGQTGCSQVKIELTGEVNEVQPASCVYN